MLLDSHCHLTHRTFREEGIEADTLIHEAREQDVSGMMLICCRIRNEFEEDILPTARAHHDIWCTVGTHPHEASKEDFTSAQIAERTQDPNVVGIGECGLDYHYDFATREDQHRVFRAHIQACLDTGLPIIIHTREAEADTMAIIDEVDPDQKLTGIMHCFSSNAQLADWSVSRGLYLSFSGMVTFKSMQWLRDIAARTPLDQLLAETDAPYLAPVPFRGKMNRPAYVRHTVQCLAEIHDTTFEEMAEITRNNYFRLFQKATRP